MFQVVTQEQQRQQQQQQLYAGPELGLDPNKLYNEQQPPPQQSQQPAYPQQFMNGYNIQSGQFVQSSGANHMTARSMPGPQVAAGSQRAGQLQRQPLHDISTLFHQQRMAVGDQRLAASTPLSFQQQQQQSVEEMAMNNWGEGVSSHIYMEVDPLYNISGGRMSAAQQQQQPPPAQLATLHPTAMHKKLPNSATQVEFITSPCSEEEELDCSTPGLGSSNCSQSSSGYSTAPPSEYYGKTRLSDRKIQKNSAGVDQVGGINYANLSEQQQINVKNLTKEHVFNLNQYHQLNDA